MISLADLVLDAAPTKLTLADLVFGEDARESPQAHESPAAVKAAITRLARSDIQRGDQIPRELHFALGVIRKAFDATINRAAESARRRVGASYTDEIVSQTGDPYRLIDLARRVYAAHAESSPERVVAHACGLLHRSAHQRAIELRRAATATKRGGLQRTPLSLDARATGEQPMGAGVAADLRHAHSDRGPGGRYLPVDRAAHVAAQIADVVKASPQEKRFIQAWITGMLSADPDESRDSYRRAIGASSSRVATTAIDKLRAKWKTPRDFADLLQGLDVDETRRVSVALIEAMLAMTPDRLVVEQGSALLCAASLLAES